MAYVPNPTDVTQPTDAIFAETAQAEFRALKAYIQSLIPAANLGGLGMAFRNRIINGSMRLDQRNVGAAYTTPAVALYTADRWRLDIPVAGKLTVQRTAVNNPAGFTTNLLMTTAVAYASLVGDFFSILQPIEGIYMGDLDFGLATAKAMTLSFWAKASIPGNYAVALKNNATRSFVSTYTITAANVWQFFTILIPGDTAGVWVTDATIGAFLIFDLGSGTNFEAPAANVWSAGSFSRVAAAQSLVANLAATLTITGVQLEASSVPTPFEIRPLPLELLLAQRYFWKTLPQGTAVQVAVAPGINTGEIAGVALSAGAVGLNVLNFLRHPVPMRTGPTTIFYNPAIGNNNQARDISISGDCSATVFVGTEIGGRIQCTTHASTVIGSLLGVHATFSAEF